MTIHTFGIDIAKNTFQLHGADIAGKGVLKKRIPRHKLAAYVANLPACTIVMESCGGANYWARLLLRSGHTVKSIGEIKGILAWREHVTSHLAFGQRVNYRVGQSGETIHIGSGQGRGAVSSDAATT